MECTMDAALRHVANRVSYLSKCDSMYIIHLSLKELGISSWHDGFWYAKHAVKILLNQPGSTLAKGVYCAAGMMAGMAAGEEQVEQAIRAAIKAAWKDRDERIWECYFPVGRAGRTQCPSNKEFLMAVADYVVMWKGFCEEVNYERA